MVLKNGSGFVYTSDTYHAGMTSTVSSSPETAVSCQVIQVKVNEGPDVFQLEVSKDKYLIWKYITSNQEELKKLSQYLKKNVSCGKDGTLDVKDNSMKELADIKEYLHKQILTVISRLSNEIKSFYLPCSGANVNLINLKQVMKGYYCYIELDKDNTELHVAVRERYETTCYNDIVSYLQSHKSNAPLTLSVCCPLCVGRMLSEKQTVQKFKMKFADTSLNVEICGDCTKITLTSARQETFEEARKWLETESLCGQTNLNTKSSDMNNVKQIVQKYMKTVAEVDVLQRYGKDVRVFWDVCVLKQEEKVRVLYCSTHGVAANDLMGTALTSLHNQELDKIISKNMTPEQIELVLTEERKNCNIFLEVAVEPDCIVLFYNRKHMTQLGIILSKLKDKAPQFPKIITSQPQSSTDINVESVATGPPGAVGKAKVGHIPYSATRHKCWESPNHHEILVAQIKADQCKSDVLVRIVESDTAGEYIYL